MSMNQQKKLLFQKTNHHASIRILLLMALLICNGYQIYLDNTYQIIFILFQGLLLVSLFAPLHECSHSTAFKSKFLNRLSCFFAGWFIWCPRSGSRNFIWSIIDTPRILQWIQNLGMKVLGRLDLICFWFQASGFGSILFKISSGCFQEM